MWSLGLVGNIRWLKLATASWRAAAARGSGFYSIRLQLNLCVRRQHISRVARGIDGVSIETDTSLPAAKGIAVLDALADERGLPDSVVVDHGPEFISRRLDIWAYQHGVQLIFIRPGKPTENAYIESFHSRFRDECLSANWFVDLADARFQIERWRRDYNEVRPHSSLGNQTPAEKSKDEQVKQKTTNNRLSA